MPEISLSEPASSIARWLIAAADAGASGHPLFGSDGLLEAAGPAGERFGVGRLCERALAGRAADATKRVQPAVRAHLCGAGPIDDISLLTIDLARAPRGPQRV